MNCFEILLKKAKRALTSSIQEFILVISVLWSMTDFKILKYQDANMQNHEALARVGLSLMAIYSCKLINLTEI